MPSIITLTTDFGYRDPYVGIMKGVIMGINPEVRIIDVTHNIERYNIREAAFTIGMIYDQFPPRTIHVVVTDPQVGSSRRPILVVGEDYYFVGPDNGVFSFLYDSVKFEVIHLTAKHYFLPEKGRTFQGRDIFAPVAAWLSKGASINNLGEPISDFVRMPVPKPHRPTKNAIEGEVIYIDHFGNAITNIRYADLVQIFEGNERRGLKILMKGMQIEMREYYAQAEDKGLYAILNSLNYLELFVYRGNASKEFDIKIGDSIGVIAS